MLPTYVDATWPAHQKVHRTAPHLAGRSLRRVRLATISASVSAVHLRTTRSADQRMVAQSAASAGTFSSSRALHPAYTRCDSLASASPQTTRAAACKKRRSGCRRSASQLRNTRATSRGQAPHHVPHRTIQQSCAYLMGHCVFVTAAAQLCKRQRSKAPVFCAHVPAHLCCQRLHNSGACITCWMSHPDSTTAAACRSVCAPRLAHRVRRPRCQSAALKCWLPKERLHHAQLRLHARHPALAGI